MRLQQWQVAVVTETKKQLPRALKNFQARTQFTLFKIFFANPRTHYEVAVRGQERLIEVGLHFEDEPSRNSELLAYFKERAFEIHAELGPRAEVEQWTNSWSRVHEVVPYQSLDENLVGIVAEKLTRMITVLEPMLQTAGKRRAKITIKTKATRSPSKAKVRGRKK
jgi:hypothetical protein